MARGGGGRMDVCSPDFYYAIAALYGRINSGAVMGVVDRVARTF